MKPWTYLSVFGLVAATGWGCSTSTDAETDAGIAITFDATVAPRDAGASVREDAATAGDDGAVPGESNIGAACEVEDDCDNGLCVGDLPGGYCSTPCDGATACPGGSACVPVGRTQALCFQTCTPGDCRDGYTCAALMGGEAVCLPGCADESECPDGLSCNPSGGIGFGSCFDPSFELGGSCDSGDDCEGEGANCLSEGRFGWPGGACVAFGCDIDSDTGCSGDSHCLPAFRGQGACFDGCDADSDCRVGYECRASDGFADREVCAPACDAAVSCGGGRVCNVGTGLCDAPFDPAELGTACSTVMGACAGGVCLREFESGYPGSYCTAGCSASTPCPGDGVCVDDQCLDGCASDADCTRAGYACLPAGTGQACLPACTSDAACANDGFLCNGGTGLCRAPFDATQLGRECSPGAGCDGGLCLTAGYPGGLCSLPGCRLTGTGPSEPCPGSSVCIDDGDGDPELGACVPTCTGGGAECRSGYVCRTVNGVNACQP